MKRLISVVLIISIFVFSCGCSLLPKDIIPFFKENPIADVIGTILSKKIEEKQITRVDKAEVNADGVNTICYEALTKPQKSIYKYILTAATHLTEGWIYCGKKSDIDSFDINIAYSAVNHDNPRIFWMPINFFIASGKNSYCFAIKIKEDDIDSDYLIKKEERDSMLASLDDKVAEICRAASEFNTDFDKELFVHDYICQNSIYELNSDLLIYTSYGALINGVCVCEGYSRAMQLIMQNLGIKCTLVNGVADSEGHMWNYINIEGNWYHLDLTWDKSDSLGIVHRYFNVTDEEILKKHEIDGLLSDMKTEKEIVNFNVFKVECNSLEENYYVHYGRILTEDTSGNANVIYSNYTRGMDTMELRTEYESDSHEIINSLASSVYPNIYISSYSKSDKTIILFFKNTY